MDNKEIKVAASSFEFIEADGEKITKEYIPYNMVQVRENELKKIEFLKILEKNFFPGCTMAMRKEIVNKYCSHHNKDIPHDWLILMLGAEENGLYWYNSKLISYRIHGNNTAGWQQPTTAGCSISGILLTHGRNIAKNLISVLSLYKRITISQIKKYRIYVRLMIFDAHLY